MKNVLVAVSVVAVYVAIIDMTVAFVCMLAWLGDWKG